MRVQKYLSAPNWSQIFETRPDLDPPGYREAAESTSVNFETHETRRLKEKMQSIHKEKQATKNKNRAKKKEPRPPQSSSPFLPPL